MNNCIPLISESDAQETEIYPVPSRVGDNSTL